LAAITPNAVVSQETTRRADLLDKNPKSFTFATVGNTDTWSSGLLGVQEVAMASGFTGGTGSVSVDSAGVFTFAASASLSDVEILVWAPDII
jgi:hypothetical protein